MKECIETTIEWDGRNLVARTEPRLYQVAGGSTSAGGNPYWVIEGARAGIHGPSWEYEDETAARARLLNWLEENREMARRELELWD